MKAQRHIWMPPPKWPHHKRWMLVVDSLEATIAMGVVGILAVVFKEPMIFPSLGATAYLLFAHPHEHQARFKNAFLSHLIAALTGWALLKLLVPGADIEHTVAALEILQPGSVLPRGSIFLYVAASALAIGVTLAVMVGTNTEHSPACSTALLFSLGFFQHLWQIGVLLAGVIALLLCGQALNWLAGFAPAAAK
jgi:CBS-domain-containing membrane protein